MAVLLSRKGLLGSKVLGVEGAAAEVAAQDGVEEAEEEAAAGGEGPHVVHATRPLAGGCWDACGTAQP